MSKSFSWTGVVLTMMLLAMFGQKLFPKGISNTLLFLIVIAGGLVAGAIVTFITKLIKSE